MPGRIQSVERAAAALRLLGEAPYPLSLAEISDGLGLARTTVHGLLTTLRHVGFVEQDRSGERYRLSPLMSGLSGPNGGAPDPHHLRSEASNWVDSLAAHTGEAALLGVIDRSGPGGTGGSPIPGVRILHHVFRPDGTPQTLMVGQTQPLHATALGKALLAGTPWLHRVLGRGQLESYTPRTITRQQVLMEEIADSRLRGWTADGGEFRPDRGGIAAPIRLVGGLCVGAVAVEASLERLRPARARSRGPADRALADRVLTTARAIGDELSAERQRTQT